jgi:hypothetical protein
LVADLKFRLLEAVEGEHRDLSPGMCAKIQISSPSRRIQSFDG